MNKTVAGFVWGVILLAAGQEQAPASPPCPPQLAKSVHVGHHTWQVDVAYTMAERERGLSGRQRIAPGTAMWFVLPGPGMHGFWMKDMAFPIDLLWITPQGRVAGVETLPPCGPEGCPIHYPPETVGFVLETLAHTAPDTEGEQATWRCGPD